MNKQIDWKDYWEDKSDPAISDFDYDRGTAPRDQVTDMLAERELVEFIDPQPWETVFDAGCGTGGNIQLLHSKVSRIVGMDYSGAAVARCKRRLEATHLENVDVHQGSISRLPLANASTDKVLCLSVLQFMNDRDVKSALSEFARVLKPNGALVLHVKNLSSLYLFSLWVGKQVKLLLGKTTKLCYYRSFRWYVEALKSAGFEIAEYNSFNVCIVPRMPIRVVAFLQRVEFRNYKTRFFQSSFIRRHGSDLKIKAKRR